MPDAKISVTKWSAPATSSSNVGKVYGTYTTDTEKKAAEANDWLLPQHRAPTPTATKVASTVKAPVPAVAAPADIPTTATSTVSTPAGSATGSAPKIVPEPAKLQLPTIPKIPGADKAGILLGAGPKFVSNTITKYTAMVPPFVPGLVINVGMVAGAISAIKAVASINPSQLLSQLTENIAGDLKGQMGELLSSVEAASNTLNDVKGQIDSIENTVENVKAGAESAVGEVTSAVDGVQSAVSDAESVADNVANNINSVGNIAETVKNEAQSAVSSTLQSAETVAQNTVASAASNITKTKI